MKQQRGLEFPDNFDPKNTPQINYFSKEKNMIGLQQGKLQTTINLESFNSQQKKAIILQEGIQLPNGAKISGAGDVNLFYNHNGGQNPYEINANKGVNVDLTNINFNEAASGVKVESLGAKVNFNGQSYQGDFKGNFGSQGETKKYPYVEFADSTNMNIKSDIWNFNGKNLKIYDQNIYQFSDGTFSDASREIQSLKGNTLLFRGDENLLSQYGINTKDSAIISTSDDPLGVTKVNLYGNANVKLNSIRGINEISMAQASDSSSIAISQNGKDILFKNTGIEGIKNKDELSSILGNGEKLTSLHLSNDGKQVVEDFISNKDGTIAIDTTKADITKSTGNILDKAKSGIGGYVDNLKGGDKSTWGWTIAILAAVAGGAYLLLSSGSKKKSTKKATNSTNSSA